MTLDLVIATYNRSSLLRRLLASLQAAAMPPRMEVRTIVVDNNSSDDTRLIVDAARQHWRGTLVYRFEQIQSKAVAVNNGLSIADADLVGLLDDDEEIDRRWFTVVDRVFRDPDVDFISGPYLPNWGAPAPDWLPPDYRAVIGWMGAGDRVLRYGKDQAGVGFGGNAVIRTHVGASVGWFDPAFGRTGSVAGGCEDIDFFERLLLTGAKGFYIPDLIIHHYIPPERLTKRYHRHWCFRRAFTQAQVDGARPQPVAHVCGVPRYMIGSAARAAMLLSCAAVTRTWHTSDTFSKELALWQLAGYVRGVLQRQLIRRPAPPSVPASLANGPVAEDT